MRRPVAAITELDGDGQPVPLVVCDDGSVWLQGYETWIEQAPIPGTLRAIAKANEQNPPRAQDAAVEPSDPYGRRT